ncbi:hypothetical protein P9H28_16850 [Paenibacillus barengoltzii]|uniref:hypothetical protein n=1 Tax=Paenibacillus barengoltzii TaxID=343517 RepID=UPI002DB96977|nr:hypothetical protein [Paenibacillus barengoltzii]MEC2345749.1 hypothetical protein [Paenibacillus barengoltzii]
MRQARDSIRRTYVSLGITHLQAYLNEYTVRRYLRMTCSEEEMRQNLLQMCSSIPAISYDQLVTHRQKHPSIATAA